MLMSMPMRRWLFAGLLCCFSSVFVVRADDAVEEHQTIPKHLSPWGAWNPPSREALRELEVGFSQELDANSLLLKKDNTPRMNFQSSCDVSHMKSCQYCAAQSKAEADMHLGATPEALFEHDLLLMMDDRPIANWTSVRRFLRPAKKFATHGLDSLDSYCGAWHDGNHFEMTFARGQSIWHSGDGVSWTKSGSVGFTTDPGYDVCVSRLERPGEPVYYMGAGLGAKQCTIRQPRLFQMAARGATIRGSPLAFGADLSKSKPGRLPTGPPCKGRPWEFLKTNWSLIPAGGDTCTHAYYSQTEKKDVLAVRYNVCTRDPKGNARWREIRGLELRVNDDLRNLKTETRSADVAWKSVLKTYLDLETKADRYRMQIYNIQARAYPFHHASQQADTAPSTLHLGVFTVLNFPKANAVSMFQANCSAVRGGQPLCDTVDAFLATSRDGIHFDAGWVYTREPLVQRGVGRGAVDTKMVLGCGQPFAHGGYMYYYYVGYPVDHESRPSSQAKHTYKTFGAKWPMHAMVGLQPDGEEAGVVLTKPFARARHISILVEATSEAGGSMALEVMHGGKTASFEFDAPRRPSADEPSFPCIIEVMTHAEDDADDGHMRLRLVLKKLSLYAIRRGPSFGHGFAKCDAEVGSSPDVGSSPVKNNRRSAPPAAQRKKNDPPMGPHADWGAPISGRAASPVRGAAPSRAAAPPAAAAAAVEVETFATDTPRAATYPLTPRPEGDDPLTARPGLEARSASIFPRSHAASLWIPEAVKSQLWHWRDGWSASASWLSRAKPKSPDPHYIYEKIMMHVEIKNGKAVLKHQIEPYKAFRVDAYMKLFKEVAARDKTLDVTLDAFAADGCPGNRESYMENCRYSCEHRGQQPAGIQACDKAAGFLPMGQPAAVKTGRGICCLREPLEGPVVTREVLPPPLAAPVFCFQKDTRNVGAALLPEIQMLYMNMYTNEKKERDPVQWAAKRSTKPHFAGAPTGPWVGASNQRIRICSGIRANSTFSEEQEGRRETSTSLVADTSLLGEVDCHLFTTADLMRTCHKSEKKGPFSTKSYSWRESLQHKYLLSLDGNGAACSRVFKILHSNSVLLKMEQEAPFSAASELFYFAGLEAWRHFVPVTEANLAERVAWLRDHDDVARNISAEATIFANTAFSREATLHYTHLLLSTLSALKRP